MTAASRQPRLVRLWSAIALAGVLAALPGALLAGEPAAPPDGDVELAIEAGLHWLAAEQAKGGAAVGSWSSPKFPTAVTSMAGLAFMANGHVPGEGPHGIVVQKAMEYVQASMTSDGYAGSVGDSMYVHAICTLFALSYLGTEADGKKDVELAQWCRKAVNVIVRSQSVAKAKVEKGGWRYSPRSHDSDLSVTAWQMLVLHAARQCGYTVNDSVINYAMAYVNSGFIRTADGAAGFVYRPGQNTVPEFGVTGTSILLKSMFEAQFDDRLIDSRNYLQGFTVGWGGPQYRGYFFFSTLYLMQGFFQLGGESYEDFSARNRKLLVEQQKGDGHWPYPYNSSSRRRGAGDVYPTAMAILILSLDKQNLPLFQRQRSFFR